MIKRNKSSNSGVPESVKIVQKPTIVYFNRTYSRFWKYSTADVLFIDDDIVIKQIFVHKFSKIIVKSDTEDEGRKFCYKTLSCSRELFQDIFEYDNTYGLIVIDQNLGPDSFTGSQCINALRINGYSGPILSISGSFHASTIMNKVKESGADAFIPKTPYFLKQIETVLKPLIKRQL
jgi:hypothetical protein